MGNEFKSLFTPFKIGNTEIKNRLFVAPMGDGYAGLGGPYGEYSDAGIADIVERAKGGWGAVVLGCTMFPDNKVDPAMNGPIYDILQFQGFFMKQGQLLNERCEAFGMKNFQQVTMGWGRNYGMYSSSPNPSFYDPSTLSPELTKDQIKQKIDSMVQMAQLCKNSGFAGVEIHALHWGYLLDNFAMAITNHREDEYGGSLENRLRVCKEIVEGVKQVCGSDYPVMMRLGLKSYIKGLNQPSLHGEEEAGRTLEEGIRIAKLLEQYGYDAMNVDVGIYDSFYYACQPTYMGLSQILPLAEACKKELNIPVLAGSRMNDPVTNEKAVRERKIDAVSIGRQSLADPYYPQKLEKGEPETIRPCIGCNVGCIGNLHKGAPVSCAVNPTVRKTTVIGLEKTLQPKKVAVIGGGIGGMETAIDAKFRGHDVTIYEKTDRLGGMAIPASAHEFKNDLKKLVAWYENEVKRLDIPVELNTEMTAEKVKKLSPDAVVIAVGSEPVMPGIEGKDHPKCVSGVDVLDGKVQLGQKIVIVGGGLVGCETAIDYAGQGKNVTLVEAAPEVLAASSMVDITISMMVKDLLEDHKVKIMAGHKIEGVCDRGAIVSPTAGGEKITVEADHVIMSIGMKSVTSNLTEELRGCGMELYQTGDCKTVGNVYTVVHGAYEVARAL
ncbi:MAG: FAD-dependent oxidoreductase [Eubacterium sp.]|nr:FAD-dependent oxidoreductase [Eubacterium sp.]